MQETKYREVDDVADGAEDDFYGDLEDGEAYGPHAVHATQPGLFRTPKHIIALLGSGLMLVLIFGLVTSLLNKGPTGDDLTAYPISNSAVNVADLDTGPRVGALAPDFELTDIYTGEPVKLSSLRGKPVWINFWASWCPPCKAELPDMKRAYDKYKEKGLVVIGVDMREDPEVVKQFTRAGGYDWTFVVDGDGKVTDRYFVYGIPTHLFIDKYGIIKAVGIGGLTPSAMENNIGTIIGP